MVLCGDSSPQEQPAKKRRILELIAASPPARPACFDSDPSWVAWLVAHHQAGERVVRRVDIGQKTAGRRTYFQVLPLAAINHCQDCDAARRTRMLNAGRCAPTAAAVEQGSAPPGTSAFEVSAAGGTEAAAAAARNRARVARYRAKRSRFDWVPGEEALRIFEAYRKAHPNMTASAILDRLVVLASRAVNVMSGKR